MKKVTFFICLISISLFGSSQTTGNSQYNDILTLQTGEDIKCKVLEVGVYEIKYQKEGIAPIYSVLKSDVFSITYPNGSKDVFTNIEEEEEIFEEEEDLGNLYLEGQQDAMKYYHGKNCGSGGTVFTTILISPLFGLIPAVVCSSTEPSLENLNIPEQDPIIGENQDYLNGYTDQALDIKKRKIWINYGISAGVSIILYSLLFSTL